MSLVVDFLRTRIHLEQHDLFQMKMGKKWVKTGSFISGLGLQSCKDSISVCTCLKFRDVPSPTEILEPLEIVLRQHIGAGKIVRYSAWIFR